MILESMEYSQFEGTRREWRLEGCTFENVNLLAGKNATGKSKTLNIISALAKLLSGQGKLEYLSGNYEVTFSKGEERVEYSLKYQNRRVVKERLVIDSRVLLNRRSDSTGKIYYQEEGRSLAFQSPENELAAVSRRDSIQHPFLDSLWEWGKSVRHYHFGRQLGQDRLAVFVKGNGEERRQGPDVTDESNVVAIFRKGSNQFKEALVASVIGDMRAIGYDLDHIGIAKPYGLVVPGGMMGTPVGLYAKEDDLRSVTDQTNMSQGMFRALSLIIQITYSQLADVPSCILIDDIGEGLDYDRSTALVKLLIERTKDTSVQLIMATNDRFVMNNVPLEYWSVIQRIGGESRIYNYRNSPKLFDDFALTGLNNFDFFSSNYYLKDVSEN